METDNISRLLAFDPLMCPYAVGMLIAPVINQ